MHLLHVKLWNQERMHHECTQEELCYNDNNNTAVAAASLSPLQLILKITIYSVVFSYFNNDLRNNAYCWWYGIHCMLNRCNHRKTWITTTIRQAYLSIYLYNHTRIMLSERLHKRCTEYWVWLEKDYIIEWLINWIVIARGW